MHGSQLTAAADLRMAREGVPANLRHARRQLHVRQQRLAKRPPPHRPTTGTGHTLRYRRPVRARAHSNVCMVCFSRAWFVPESGREADLAHVRPRERGDANVQERVRQRDLQNHA